jgi:hypothetical protein
LVERSGYRYGYANSLRYQWGCHRRTGHRSLEMLKTYSRDAEAFVGHAGAGLL